MKSYSILLLYISSFFAMENINHPSLKALTTEYCDNIRNQKPFPTGIWKDQILTVDRARAEEDKDIIFNSALILATYHLIHHLLIHNKGIPAEIADRLVYCPSEGWNIHYDLKKIYTSLNIEDTQHTHIYISPDMKPYCYDKGAWYSMNAGQIKKQVTSMSLNHYYDTERKELRGMHINGAYVSLYEKNQETPVFCPLNDKYTIKLNTTGNTIFLQSPKAVLVVAQKTSLNEFVPLTIIDDPKTDNFPFSDYHYAIIKRSGKATVHQISTNEKIMSIIPTNAHKKFTLFTSFIFKKQPITFDPAGRLCAITNSIIIFHSALKPDYITQAPTAKEFVIVADLHEKKALTCFAIKENVSLFFQNETLFMLDQVTGIILRLNFNSSLLPTLNLFVKKQVDQLNPIAIDWNVIEAYKTKKPEVELPSKKYFSKLNASLRNSILRRPYEQQLIDLLTTIKKYCYTTRPYGKEKERSILANNVDLNLTDTYKAILALIDKYSHNMTPETKAKLTQAALDLWENNREK